MASDVLSAQDFLDFVGSLYSSAVPQRQARVDSFFNANTQYPMIENDTTAIFLLKGAYGSVDLAGDMNGWQTGIDALSNVSNTDMWFQLRNYPSNARLDYKFVADNAWILDPRNPNTVTGGYGPNSELAMPMYVQPWEIEDRPGIPKGNLSSHTIQSTIMGSSYQVQVYLPPAYDTNATYPTAYFHDGQEYVSLANAQHILDNLIDSNLISPLIGVFVQPNNRNDEYAFGLRANYANFFSSELVQWVDSRYATRIDSASRATIGASFGGNISGYILANHHDVFGMHGQHSGAWWPNNMEVLNMVVADWDILNLPMASVWGGYEGGLTGMWRILTDSIQFYQIPDKHLNEYPEGHSWGLWRATLDEILVELFPPSGIGTEESMAIPRFDLSLFPNPVADQLHVLMANNTEIVELQVRNLFGQKIWEGEGSNELNIDVSQWPSGLYFLILEEGSQRQVKRFLKE